ncbi:MAG TPA: hypothetical protein VHG93_21420 [Longimicrobium sp.]|nr:hypothetical protein [Longimicrobium sp.]
MAADPTPWPASWLQAVPAAVPDEEYRAFVAGLQVVGVRFAKAAVYAPAIYIPDASRRPRFTITRDARYLNFAQGFTATMVFHFRGWWTDEPTSGVSAEAEVEVLYRSPVLMSDDLFQRFKEGHLPGHTWPYLREFLHSALGRTGWPIYTLPLFAPGKSGGPASPAPGGLNG